MPAIRPVLPALCALTLGAHLAACSDDDAAPQSDAGTDVADTNADTDRDVGDVGEDADAAAPSVAEQLGITQYVGQIDPVEVSSDDGETTFTFDAEQGPMCMRGADYQMAIRDTGSDDLVIFMQGGGACWSAFCLAVTGAPAGVPNVDILRDDLETNPVRDWNVVYMPYCDGSFFAGDATHDDNLNDKGTRTHRGLANLTGALEVSAERFPTPRRILLAGSSGGAYGLLLGAPLVRHYYPDAELIVMADSGIGVAREGEPAFIQTAIDEFNITRFLPDDCDGCLETGHLTAIVSWYLERDDNIRVGTYSSWHDSVLATTFMQIPGPRFADGLENQTNAVHAAYPDRFRRFIARGSQHTSLLGDPTGIIGTDLGAVELPDGALQSLMGGDLVIEGIDDTVIGDVNIATWVGAMIDNDLDAWVDLVEPREGSGGGE